MPPVRYTPRMPVIALFVFIAQLLAVQRGPAPKFEESGAVEGRVVNASTGEPLNKATVRLRPRDGSRGMYSGSTDPSGNFTVAGVAPGAYHVSASRNGFVNAEYGMRGAPISVGPGQRVAGILIRMTPHGVIAGRVVDEDGEAVAGVQVQAMQYRYPQGRKRLMIADNATTNDLGEYRLYGLAPGRYYVSAAPQRSYGPRAATQGPVEEHVTTWYPNTQDAAAASPVEVAAGSQLRGIDLSLAKRRTYRVRGKVTDASGSAGGRIMVMLRSRAAHSTFVNRPANLDRAGNFEIAGVTPGAYTLIAMLPGRGRSLSARMPVDVGDDNLDNLNVVINPPLDVSGKLRVEGQTSVSLTGMRVGLSAREPGVFGGAVPGRVEADGSFTLAGVSPDEYDVTVSGLPEGVYVKAILANGQDVLLPGLNLTHGPVSGFQIVLSPNAGAATGIVRDDRQEPAVGTTVALVPREKERRPVARFYHTVTSDATGRFAFRNLAPGQYLVFAWQDVESGAWFDPDFLRPLENSAQPVNVREGGQEDVKVSLIR